MRKLISFAVVIASLVSTGATRAVLQDESTPRLLNGSPQAAYPSAASRAGVEGTVEFNALVSADGTVESVDVVRVPSPNVGFEEAVRETVRRWRFAAAMRGGVAIASTYHGSMQFQLSIAGEWIYPARSHDVWVQVRQLIRDLKLSTERVDDQHQLLITRMVSYPSQFPDARALDLRLGQIPDAIQFHVSVAPGMEPARVAIGSTIHTRSVVHNREGFLIYANTAASDWFQAKLTSRLARTPEPLARAAVRRAEQSRRLMPAGVSDPCTEREAVLLPAADRGTPPTALSEVKPVYPRNELEGGREATVKFKAEITEHGTLINMLDLAPSDASESFQVASELAGSLWRFDPAKIDGCRARVSAMFSMSFKTR